MSGSWTQTPRKNGQERRDPEREPTEEGAVGGQASEEVNQANVPRGQTKRQKPLLLSHNGLMEPNTAGAPPGQANEALHFQQPGDGHMRHLEERFAELQPASGQAIAPPRSQFSEERGMQLADNLVIVPSRYPNRLMELNVEVPLYRLPSRDTQSVQVACYPQLYSGQTCSGAAPFAIQMDRSRGLANGVRYSIQESIGSHSQEQGQAVEQACMTTFLEQQTLNRSSPAEAAITAGRICGGKYKWPIKNFSCHLQDAIDEKIASVESPVIFTSLFDGYKFFARIFPNGINSGEGRHVGLFIGMMQGEDDNNLEWPFIGQISLTILDQSDGEFRNHISGTFVANRNQRAFQKPTAAQNPTLYGYAEFAPTDLVCSHQYSRDDTVTVKIEIDIIP